MADAPEPEPADEGAVAWVKYVTQGSVMVTTLLAVGICHRIHRTWLQESMVFIFFGAMIATGILLAERGDDVESRAFFSQYFSFDADQFFFLLLPPIILDAAYNMPTKSNFFFNASSILAFAFLGTFISTIVIGTSVWGASILVQNSGATRELGFERVTWAFKFSSMLSATDPVATLSVLSSFGQLRDAHLFNLIFGESILNDAVAIVLFEEFDRGARAAPAPPIPAPTQPPLSSPRHRALPCPLLSFCGSAQRRRKQAAQRP